MIVIYGHRHYGVVDEQGGQHAVTKFIHVYYLPLIPTSSMWLTSADRGIPIKLNSRSVVAAYARTWGLGIGGICLATAWSKGAIGLGLFGAVVAAFSIASWRWRKRSSSEDVLRGNLNALAFGTYCSAESFGQDTAAAMRSSLENRQQCGQTWSGQANAWQRGKLPRTPEDVVRFGTRDVEELSWAYGLLALHGAKATSQVNALLQLKAPANDGQGIYRQAHAVSYRADGIRTLELTSDATEMANAIGEAAMRAMNR
jgi:hypothetical protein